MRSAVRQSGFRLGDISTVFFGVLLVMVIVRLWIASDVELHFDEAYYWYWSKNPQLSYFDHPPMVTWLIRAGTALYGDTELGVRFLGPVCGLIVSLLVFDAADRAYGRQAACLAGLAVQATLLVGAGSILMTPDIPLLLFSTATMWALVRYNLYPDPRWWLVAGLCGGAALLSKYTALFLAISVGLWLLLTPNRRRLLTTPWPWAGLSISLICFLPVLIWNAQNGWVSFARQGGRLARDYAIRPDYLIEFIAGQAGQITPVLFAALVWAVWIGAKSAIRTREATLTLLILMVLVPGTVFLGLSFFMRVQGNWPDAIWPPAILVMARFASMTTDRFRRLATAGITTGFVIVGMVWIYAISPFGPCVAGDPFALLNGQRQLSARVGALAQANNADLVVTPDYATASMLRFYAPDGIQIAHIAAKQRYIGFNQVLPHQGQMTLIVSRKIQLPERIRPRFEFLGSPGEIRRNHKGCRYDSYAAVLAKRI